MMSYLEAVVDEAPDRQLELLRELCAGDDEMLEEAAAILANADKKEFLRSPTSEDAEEALIGSSLGEFTLLEIIGRGGMGTVYRARQHSLGREVAVKVFANGGGLRSKVAFQRFQREARSIARLRHPSIVDVIAQGESEGLSYFAMELIEGRTLREVVAERGRDDIDSEAIREIVGWMEAITAALQFAHDLRIVHRDVKPQNILIDSAGAARLVDFGVALDEPLADEEGGPLSATGDLLGTPGYMSPEQLRLRAAKIDGRSDVYSCGVVLYEALSGVRPYAGTTAVEVSEQIAAGQWPSLRSRNPKLPRAIGWIVEKALEKLPEARYQSAGDLSLDLQRFLDGHPTSAGPRPLDRRVARWAKPHRRALLVGGALAAVSSAAYLARRTQPSKAGCTLAIDSIPSGADVRALPIDIETHLPVSGAEWVDLGKTPLQRATLEPGAWRITMRSAGGLFGELRRSFMDTQVIHGLPLFGALLDGALAKMIEIPGWEIDINGRGYHVPGFRIDATEVSNGAYREFVLATGHRHPPFWPNDWSSGFEPAWASRPVAEVSLDDASAFAAWCGKRLPDWLEWQRAARGSSAFSYPWGDDWGEHRQVADMANIRWRGRLHAPYKPMSAAMERDFQEVRRAYMERCLPVTQGKEGRSPFGLHRCFGNVREWTANCSTEMVGERAQAQTGTTLVAGSSWLGDRRLLSVPSLMPSNLRAEELGFRCAVSLHP